MTRTSTDGDTNGTHAGSRPVLYELIAKDGRSVGTFPTVREAAAIAREAWPDQQQDPERTGAGWDVQCVGVK